MTVLPNTANEVETFLHPRNQEAHVDVRIFTQLPETHCLYVSETSS